MGWVVAAAGTEHHTRPLGDDRPYLFPGMRTKRRCLSIIMLCPGDRRCGQQTVACWHVSDFVRAAG